MDAGPNNSSEAKSAHDRRRGDRRDQPTNPIRRWIGPKRRAGGRRANDQAGYVDTYTRQEVLLLLAIFVLNVLDALFTMMWLSRGGREANPVMDFFLDIGPGAFIMQKCFFVGFWLIVLLVHKNFRFARIGLYIALAVYSALLILHFSILALGIEPPKEADANPIVHYGQRLSEKLTPSTPVPQRAAR